MALIAFRAATKFAPPPHSLPSDQMITEGWFLKFSHVGDVAVDDGLLIPRLAVEHAVRSRAHSTLASATR